MNQANNNTVAMHGGGHGSIKSYVIGFIISIILTVIPFVIVGHELLAGAPLFIAIAALALLQLFVQAVYFLHLNSSSESRWNVMTFLFTILVVVILIAGSIWIMWSLNYYMVH